MDRDTLWLIPLIIDGRGKTGLPPISDLVAMVSLDEQEETISAELAKRFRLPMVP